MRLIFWRRSDRVSDRWLKEADRTESTRGIDSVVWRWPVQKLINESACFQTTRLKRKVS